MDTTSALQRPSFRTGLLNVLKRDRYIYAVIFLLFVATSAVGYLYGLENRVKFFVYAKLFAGASVLTFIVIFIGYFFVLAKNQVPRPTLTILRKGRDVLTNWPEVIGLLLMMSALTVFMSSFTSLKVMIPLINPYEYDVAFADIDRFLHFGIDPWKITHAVFNTPFLTGVVNFFYNLWFFLFWTVWVYFLVRLKPEHDRQQYLISFILSWMIIGGVFAIFLSSAGPCYYAHLIDTPDPFAALMDRLYEQRLWIETNDSYPPLWALDTQNMLWDNYMAEETAVGSGISAMPSMHLSVATMMALGMYRISRFWGYVFWVYVAMIQIGSVHLAWHYAIDGYVSIILTIIIWKIVGRFTKPGQGKVIAKAQ
ncbi:membrane protein [Kordiimonas sediminis]|uniref:Membrane protein n=1 Tax=Kordiimonas sediminis TaxID=1735581 RepID=A0A919AQC8_9PROT|nr:phosphatase PAP2 family protein [Kordiimonas sediminis]GHF19631.1 membrane protein [Kordiimonas sediminis]